MQIIIKLNDDFHPDSSIDATITAKNEALETVGRVTVQFDADNTGKHRILLDFDYPAALPHYTQAKIIYEASLMIDSHFDDAGEVEPYTGKLIEA